MHILSNHMNRPGFHHHWISALLCGSTDFKNKTASGCWPNKQETVVSVEGWWRNMGLMRGFHPSRSGLLNLHIHTPHTHQRLWGSSLHTTWHMLPIWPTLEAQLLPKENSGDGRLLIHPAGRHHIFYILSAFPIPVIRSFNFSQKKLNSPPSFTKHKTNTSGFEPLTQHTGSSTLER